MSLKQSIAQLRYEYNLRFPSPMGLTGKRSQDYRDYFHKNLHHSTPKKYPFQTSFLSADPTQPIEQLPYYLPYNLIKACKISPLGRLIKQTLSTNSLFIDIGANLGLYSLLAKAKGAQTIAFEPEPQHVKFLKKQDYVDTLHAVGLSDNAGSFNFHIHPENTGGSSLVNTPGSTIITVPVDRFDTLLDTITLPDNILIKIDVEGNEDKTLLGFEKALKNNWRPRIYCEVRGPQSDRNTNSYKTCTDILAEFGYTPHTVSHRGHVQPFNPKKPVPQIFDLYYLPS